MSFYLNPRSIAVEGVGFGVKAMTMFGFNWLTVEVVPPVIEETNHGGGVVSGSPARLIISIKVNGKWNRSEYNISNFVYNVVSILAKRIDVSFTFSAIKQSLVSIATKVKLTNIDQIKPEIRVKESKPNFTIRRSK